jgi:hypothetical protein
MPRLQRRTPSPSSPVGVTHINPTAFTDVRPGGPIRLVAESRTGEKGWVEIALQPGQVITDVKVTVR